MTSDFLIGTDHGTCNPCEGDFFHGNSFNREVALCMPTNRSIHLQVPNIAHLSIHNRHPLHSPRARQLFHNEYNCKEKAHNTHHNVAPA